MGGRIRLAALWQGQLELGQAAGKLSRTSAPESSLQKHSHGNMGSAIKAN